MLEDLENALAEHAPAGGELASELPPLTIDGIPVSVDKMTQVRLSAIMLRPSCISGSAQLLCCLVLGVPSRGHQRATNHNHRWFDVCSTART